MSEFTDILTASIQLKRLTDNVLDNKAVAASMSADRNPRASSRLAIEVAGCTIAAGSVTVAGSTNEVFSFTENGVRVGTKDFTSISGITVAGISDGFIQIRAVTKTGQPINQERTIYASLAVRFFALSGKIRMMATGQEKVAEYGLMAAPGMDIQENDIIYPVSGISGLTMGRVSFVEDLFDFDGSTTHIEAEIMRP
jgi:hypothetical protein